VKIERQDFGDGFKKWKERTSTSPSGRHLGHYKSIIKDTGDCKKSSKQDGGAQLRQVDILGDLAMMTSLHATKIWICAQLMVPVHHVCDREGSWEP